jgi:DNA-binding LytR/AlgR family response regulator
VHFPKNVGRIPISFHSVIIIVIISLTAITVLVITNRIYFLKQQLETLTSEPPKEKEVLLPAKETEVELESENKTEYFKLPLEQIVVIKSASNCIEVHYLECEKLHKRLIRNTLKSMEELLAAYPEMIRCHRSFIVNKNISTA